MDQAYVYSKQGRIQDFGQGGGDKNFRNKNIIEFRNQKIENRYKICARLKKKLRLGATPLRIGTKPVEEGT